MKKFLIQAVLLVLLTGFGLFLFKYLESSNPTIPFIPQPAKMVNLQVNNTVLKVEIADSKEKRNKGLAGREKLASDEGMLFIFEKPDKYAFWMKGLKFALDFVWIKDDIVVDILENIPPPTINQADGELPVYSAKVEINKVLELNTGTISKLNIKVGDKIQIINP